MISGRSLSKNIPTKSRRATEKFTERVVSIVYLAFFGARPIIHGEAHRSPSSAGSPHPSGSASPLFMVEDGRIDLEDWNNEPVVRTPQHSPHIPSELPYEPPAAALPLNTDEREVPRRDVATASMTDFGQEHIVVEQTAPTQPAAERE